MATKKKTSSTTVASDVLPELDPTPAPLIGELAALITDIIEAERVGALTVHGTRGVQVYEIQGADGTSTTISVVRRDLG